MTYSSYNAEDEFYESSDRLAEEPTGASYSDEDYQVSEIDDNGDFVVLFGENEETYNVNDVIQQSYGTGGGPLGGWDRPPIGVLRCLNGKGWKIEIPRDENGRPIRPGPENRWIQPLDCQKVIDPRYTRDRGQPQFEDCDKSGS